MERKEPALSSTQGTQNMTGRHSNTFESPREVAEGESETKVFVAQKFILYSIFLQPKLLLLI
jgi:hypothetical protein